MAETTPTSAADLQSIARQIAQEEGVDPALVLGVIEQESNWNPKAVSRAGAQGLMQIMPATGRGLGLKDPFDPVQNIRAGTRYLKQQLQRFGDTALALTAYNWGPGNAAKLVNNPRRVTLPKETEKYVPAVFSKMGKYGPTEAPTNIGLAFFPGMKDVVKGEITKGVAARTGAIPPVELASLMKTQGADMARDQVRMSVPPAAMSGLPRPVDDTRGAPGAPLPTSAAEALPSRELALPTVASLTGTGASREPTSLGAFLKARFGPLSDVADPFPKAFDAELSRLLDRS